MSRGVGWGQDREGTYVRPVNWRRARPPAEPENPCSDLRDARMQRECEEAVAQEQVRFRESAIAEALVIVQTRADWQTRLGPDKELARTWGG